MRKKKKTRECVKVMEFDFYFYYFIFFPLCFPLPLLSL
jgi:hypothetical protein